MAKRTLGTLLAIGGLLLACAGPASAEFGVLPGSFFNDPLDASGDVFTQAGGHPESLSTAFEFTRVDAGEFEEPGYPSGNLNGTVVDLPAGVLGNPQSVPQCPRDLVTTSESGSDPHCPAATQVGIARVLASTLTPGPHVLTFPIYNIVPDEGEAAAFAFSAVGATSILSATVRTGSDYGVRITVRGVPSANPIYAVRTEFWGVPGDPSHDPDRVDSTPRVPATPVRGQPFGFTVRPFLNLPSDCSAPAPITGLRVNAYDHPAFRNYSYTGTQVTGCDRLSFEPAMTATGSGVAGQPGGLEVALTVPQNDDPDGLATPPLRKAVVSLPEGTTVSPSSADGLGSCSPAEIALDNDREPTCPESSKIGTVKIDTPVLADPLEGSLYVARQGDNPFGSLLAMYLVAKGQGTLVKLPGRIDLDPVTGRVKTTFDNNPQLPFSKLTLKLKGGARAPLANPRMCGTYDVPYELTAWSGQVVSSATQMTIDKGCGALAFAPALSAGVASPIAGAGSPFSLKLTRTDGDQALKQFEVALPTGMLATLAGVTQCSESTIAAINTAVGFGRGEIANPSCPANSLLGSATVGAGSGPEPLYVQTGKVYLAGPYKGAPYSLAVVTPAVAGPFDLGTVVVRAALAVDPIDAHVTARVDPLPTILAGIPLQIRDIRNSIDRPGFMLNPTNCAEKQITGTATSVDAAAAAIGSRFQVGNCAALALKPELGLSLSGKGQTTDGKHPAITATLVQKPGQSNLKKVRVALPLSLALDTDNANGLCEFVEGSKVTPTCPKASIVGSVTATTPILDEPLSGPVYFVKNVRKDPKSGRDIRTLPKLVIPLVGQNGLKLTLTGTSDVKGDQLVTTFDNIPDAPVSSFKLNINGGKGGILVVSDADICKSTQIAEQQVDGQNNKQADTEVFIQTPSCPLKVMSKKVGKRSVAVKVGGLGAGKVTVAGKGIKKTTKTITKSTVATITAKRIKGKPGKVTVSFDPTGPAKARKTSK